MIICNTWMQKFRLFDCHPYSWMSVLIFCPGLLNHQGEVENDRQPSRLVPTTATGQFFCLHSYLLYSLLQEEAGCCWRGQFEWGCWRNEGWQIWMWNIRYERDSTHMATVFSYALVRIVSRAGAALRLCTLTNASCSSHAHKHSKATGELGTRKIICYCLHVFSLCPTPHHPWLFLSASAQQWPIATPSLMTTAVWHSLKVVN